MKTHGAAKRNAYTKHDEDKMKRYVRRHEGSPLSLKFWREAHEVMHLQHSPDSLKCHWRWMMQGNLT